MFDQLVITPCKTGVIVSSFASQNREPLIATNVFSMADLMKEADEILVAYKGRPQ